MNAYATTAQLAEFLPAAIEPGVDEADTERLLARASEVIDAAVRVPFSIDDDGIPTDATVAETLRDACCAQVEFWAEVGEGHDVAGMGGRQVSLLGLSMQSLPTTLAPRAKRIITNAGLSSAAVSAGVLMSGRWWE